MLPGFLRILQDAVDSGQVTSLGLGFLSPPGENLQHGASEVGSSDSVRQTQTGGDLCKKDLVCLAFLLLFSLLFAQLLCEKGVTYQSKWDPECFQKQGLSLFKPLQEPP